METFKTLADAKKVKSSDKERNGCCDPKIIRGEKVFARAAKRHRELHKKEGK